METHLYKAAFKTLDWAELISACSHFTPFGSILVHSFSCPFRLYLLLPLYYLLVKGPKFNPFSILDSSGAATHDQLSKKTSL